MLYYIDRIDDKKDKIVESLRRSDKAQAYGLARQQGRQYPEQNIFITETENGTDRKIIAYISKEDLSSTYTMAERLSTATVKIQTLLTLFDKTVEKEVGKGMDKVTAKKLILEELSKQAA